MVEPETHSLDGIWQRKNSDIISQQESGKLLIPITISRDGSYELEIEFTDSGHTFHDGEFVTIPVGNVKCSLSLQSRGSPTPTGASVQAQFSGPGIGGGGFTAVRELTPNKRHRFKIKVEQVGKATAKVHCELDGKPCYDSDTQLPEFDADASGKRLAGTIILCANANQELDTTVFHAVRLRLSAGSARLLK